MDFLIVLVIVLSFMGLMYWILYEFWHWLVDGYSPTVNTFKNLATRHRIKNKLFQCDDCEKLYRQYQLELTKDSNENKYCPHCNSFKRRRRNSDKRLVEYHKGLDYHPDCPKVNMWSHMKIKHTAKSLRDNEKQMEHDKFFQEYNKAEVDFKWIENLKSRRE